MRRAALQLLLLISAILLFTSAWILLPPTSAAVFPLAVGAPEISPALLALSVVFSALASIRARRFGLARLALVLSATSAIVCAIPLARLPGTVQGFEQATSSTRAERPRMRREPFVAGDMARGFGPDSGVRVINDVEMAMHDGDALRGKIYQPTSPGRFPVLVQVYGGSWQTGSPESYVWFARYFGSRGYLVVAPDYRHAPQSRWPAQLEDIEAALKWVMRTATRFNGDPSRIILVGRSAGAHLALLAAYQERSPDIRGVVAYYGPTDLAEGWRTPPRPDPLRVRSILETFLGGSPAQMPERYRHASPMAHVSGRVPPTLLVYGTRDHIVEAKFGRLLHSALRKAGATSVLLEIPWAEHAFDAVPYGLSSQVSLYYTERFIAWTLTR